MGVNVLAHLKLSLLQARNFAAFARTGTLQKGMKLRSVVVLCSFILVLGVMTQAPDEGYSREQLQPLTKFRCALS
jgi:hypothetical protein